MTAIQWTDVTWNPVRGCSRVSAGCDNCYAMGQAHRFNFPADSIDDQCVTRQAGPYYGLTTIRRGKVDWTGHARLVPEMLAAPIKWKKPQRVFVNSMSDLFHESLSNKEIAAVFGVMVACSQHTFQVLTKRPKRMKAWFEWVKEQGYPPTEEYPWTPLLREAMARLPVRQADQLREDGIARDGVPSLEPWPLPNVHLGVSVENQAAADERIPLLLETPAAVRFVSAEPLLEPVDLTHWLNCPKPGLISDDPLAEFFLAEAMRDGCASGPRALDWVILGGESGTEARPCNVEWIRSIVRQCEAAGVSCFVKQLGVSPYLTDSVGRLKLRDKKGGDPSEWPEDLQVREFPK